MTDCEKLCNTLKEIGCEFTAGEGYIEIHSDSIISFGSVVIDFYDDGSFKGFVAVE